MSECSACCQLDVPWWQDGLPHQSRRSRRQRGGGDTERRAALGLSAWCTARAVGLWDNTLLVWGVPEAKDKGPLAKRWGLEALSVAAACSLFPSHDVTSAFPVPRAIWVLPPLLLKPALSRVSTIRKLYKSFRWGRGGMKGYHLQIV